MSAIYDNWERLVAAVLRREQLWQLFHSPSLSSETESRSSSSFRLDPGFRVETSNQADLFQYILQHPENTVFMFHRHGGTFGIDDLMEASGEVIGKGKYGISYKAVVGNDSVAVLVKRLKLANHGFSAGKEFTRQMKVIAKISHENVFSLRGYCYSEEETVVLYEYYHGGSAASLLHGERVMMENRRLNWETRLRIGMGIARGICHIHSHNLVHGSIESSSVFLNQQGYGCISGLGLAPLGPNSAALSGGYYAPEVTETKKFTQESDVYSFGVLLLELLTGRCPLQRIGYYEQHLVSWVSWLLQDNELPYVVFLNVPASDHESQKEEMEKMLQVSMSCVHENPKHRQKMNNVAEMMDRIWKDFIEHRRRERGRKRTSKYSYSVFGWGIDDEIMIR